MSREKQIEEMAKVMCDFYGTEKCYDCRYCCDCHLKQEAERLYNAGYRKQSEPISCGHEKSEWISVEERLPDKDGEYLTWNGIIYYLIWFNASLGLWNVSEDGNTSAAIRGVTHWMPLPEAPKKGGE